MFEFEVVEEMQILSLRLTKKCIKDNKMLIKWYFNKILKKFKNCIDI